MKKITNEEIHASLDDYGRGTDFQFWMSKSFWKPFALHLIL